MPPIRLAVGASSSSSSPHSNIAQPASPLASPYAYDASSRPAHAVDLAPPVSPISPNSFSAAASSHGRAGKEPASDRPPRPMNAWLLFRTAQLRQIQEDNPGMRKSQGELSKIISEMWKTCDPEVRAGYEALAKERKLEHQRIYPDYRYASAPKTGNSSKSKAKRSPGSTSSARKPSLRLSPSQLQHPHPSLPNTAPGSLYAPSTPAASAPPSSEPLYHTQFSDFDPSSSSSSSTETSPAWGVLPIPPPPSATGPSRLTFVPYEEWTPPQTAGLPTSAGSSTGTASSSSRSHFPQSAAAGGAYGGGPGSSRMAVSRSQQYQHQQVSSPPSEMYGAYDSLSTAEPIPASAPPTVTRFAGGTFGGRTGSLGLTFVPTRQEEPFQHSSLSATAAQLTLADPSARHAPPSASSSAFGYDTPSHTHTHYLSPPATATFASTTPSGTPATTPSFPPSTAPLALAAPPRRQPLPAQNQQQQPTIAGWAAYDHRGSSAGVPIERYEDEPEPPSPFLLPPQQVPSVYHRSHQQHQQQLVAPQAVHPAQLPLENPYEAEPYHREAAQQAPSHFAYEQEYEYEYDSVADQQPHQPQEPYHSYPSAALPPPHQPSQPAYLPHHPHPRTTSYDSSATTMSSAAHSAHSSAAPSPSLSGALSPVHSRQPSYSQAPYGQQHGQEYHQPKQR
ncbi:hypothetical protein JCM8097_002956 [Rhodosporidiobolus ruineniae]